MFEFLWLYGKPGQRELPYFIRENQELLQLDKTNFSEGEKLKVLLFGEEIGENQIFRDNSLFLSTLASFGFGKLSKQLIENLSTIRIISGLGHSGMYQYAGKSLGNDEKKEFIIDFLKKGDIGIEDLKAVDVSFSDLPKGIDDDIKRDFDRNQKKKMLISTRKKFDEHNNPVLPESFSFVFHESEGTQKLFELSPFIYEAIKEQKTIIIDEFDARFHPLLTKKIVELFNSRENIGAQLIFTTHDTNLLSSDLLRRDQIEFVEKDRFGASHLYSLVEFKGIRNTASFEKDYIQGKYGAIPFLGDFSEILNHEMNA